MAFSENIIVTETTVTTNERLDKICIQVGFHDLERTLRLVAATAITEQISLGNKPTNILVDNSGSKSIKQAQRRVQAFFIDKDAIREAVFEAWNHIQRLTRLRSGAARLSYQLWFNNTPIGKTPAAVDIYIARMNPSKDFFRIVGPVLVYGRRIYWNPLGRGKSGKPRLSRRVALRTGSAIYKVVRVVGIMKQVQIALRRKFRGIAVAESWVTTTALPKDGRTPALYIGFKKKGAVSNG